MKLAPDLVLLNGFDRSGSSMMAQLLGAHPGAALVFHPFNSTEVHRDQWRIWSPTEAHPSTLGFWNALRQARLDRSYLRSHWHDAHGHWPDTTPHTIFVKDTKLHFHLDWLRAQVPQLRIQGIWRAPEDILGSLTHNGFHETWYGGEHYQTLLDHWPVDLEALRSVAARAADAVERMAVMIAARTAWFFARLRPEAVLCYRSIVSNPNELRRVFAEATDFDFGPLARRDHNVSGVARPADADRSVPALATEAFDITRALLPHLFVRTGEAWRWRPSAGDELEPHGDEVGG